MNVEFVPHQHGTRIHLPAERRKRFVDVWTVALVLLIASVVAAPWVLPTSSAPAATASPALDLPAATLADREDQSPAAGWADDPARLMQSVRFGNTRRSSNGAPCATLFLRAGDGQWMAEQVAVGDRICVASNAGVANPDVELTVARIADDLVVATDADGVRHRIVDPRNRRQLADDAPGIDRLARLASTPGWAPPSGSRELDGVSLVSSTGQRLSDAVFAERVRFFEAYALDRDRLPAPPVGDVSDWLAPTADPDGEWTDSMRRVAAFLRDHRLDDIRILAPVAAGTSG